MTERRKDDDCLERLVTMTERHGILIEQVHKSWFGANGNDGYKTKIDKMEGGFAAWKWAAGSGGLVGIVALLVTLYKLFSGG